MISELENDFDKARIFGDERDFELFNAYTTKEGSNCIIPIHTSYMYPESQNDPQNKRELSPECVQGAIAILKKVLSNDSRSSVILHRIDVTQQEKDPLDISNRALLMMSSYYEIKEARRTDPEKARFMENQIVENMKLIAKLREGRISQKEFEKEMQKRRKTAETKFKKR